MSILCCNVPSGTKESDFNPFPGNEIARRSGCTCPDQSLANGQIRIDTDCPLHKLERATN